MSYVQPVLLKLKKYAQMQIDSEKLFWRKPIEKLKRLWGMVMAKLQQFMQTLSRRVLSFIPSIAAPSQLAPKR